MAGSLRLSRLKAVLATASMGLLAGCGTTVVLDNMQLPEALVEPYPLTAAVRFGKDVESFVYEETLPSGGTYTIDLGRASALMFTETLKDMFADVVPVTPDTLVPEGIDLLVEPSLVALEFAIPAQTVTKDYAVWIRYQIRVYDSEGVLQAEYPLSAYGKAARESLMGGTESALRSAASLAIRDAAVLMLLGFEREAALAKNQLAGLAVAQQPPAPLGAETPPKPATTPEQAPAPTDDAEKFL
ncbi:MAG: hypothetical protein AAF545_00740 [Pseudomonadota bacterium]